MSSAELRSNLLLLVAAIIWGFAFVAQRVGMEYVGPFTFNGIRFTLGFLVLVPFLLRRKKEPVRLIKNIGGRRLITWSIITSLFLFAGAALQQLGIQTTTAGKAGFLTGLYVVFVPVAGLFFHQKSGIFIWAGMILSAVGLYFLCITSEFGISRGDLLVLLCAVVFTGHVLMVGLLSPKMDSFIFAGIQFLVCAVLNLVVAFSTETIRFGEIINAAIPLCYGGIFSIGIAFTLQVWAQKKTHPAHASIILSLEAVFAAFGGWIILGEYLTNRALFGCFLMLAGMIVVQVLSTANPKSGSLPSAGQP
jgi:drug/metabolite transporter (DMT)-like permease